jgi:hypothetical protein
MRRLSIIFAALLVGLFGLSSVPLGNAATDQKGPARLYSVLYAQGASLSAAHAAVNAAG